MALLRLAQGRVEAAAAAIRRATDETASPSRGPGCWHRSSRSCCARDQPRRRAWQQPRSRNRRGRGRSAPGFHRPEAGWGGAASERDPRRALAALRASGGRDRSSMRLRGGADACAHWPGLPELGDDDAAGIELDAAREVFATLGAIPDLERVDALRPRAAPAAAGSRRASWTCCARRGRQDEPGRRGGPGDQREDGGPSPKQHLRQARRVIAFAATAFAYEHRLTEPPA